MLRKALILIMLCACSAKLISQVNYTAEDVSNMVVCLGDQFGKDQRLLGTATVLSDSGRYYLLTATHVANLIAGDCFLIFKSTNDTPVMVELERFTGRKTNFWKNHNVADISIIEISAFDLDSQERLKHASFPVSSIMADKTAIPREFSVMAIGYPIVDSIGEHFSPLTFNSFFSSGLISLKRADTKNLSIFQLLENPSIQGYSGGPVLIGVKKAGVSIGWAQTMIVGIMHGTFSDDTGGKLAMITPSFYVFDLLK